MSPAREAGLRIEVQDGPQLDLPDQGLVVIGRSRERAALVLEGEGIDEAHCAIGRVKPGGFAVKDLGSRGGTFVNGARVESARVGDGDVISIGSRRLRIVDPSAGGPKSPVRAAPGAALNAARKVPERLAGYRVERLVGRGGMGEVYLAIQESLSRPVALKVLSAELAADADFVRRFQSEARSVAALSHPNVVVVYDVGEGAGLHFLSMEFMAGGSLEERVAREGPMPWREVLGVLREASAGLAFAESRGILHRDIKPANLMLSASGAVKIADLGLATPVASQESGEERRTFGTPHFVSPEQARGEVLDARSDLYSLGATAYRLLTGRTPFQGANTREILRARFQSDPVPPRSIVPGIPPMLESIVLRLMAREPAGRPASAEVLGRELDRVRLELDHGLAVPRAGGRRKLLALAGLVVLAGAPLAYYGPRWLGLGTLGAGWRADAGAASAPGASPASSAVLPAEDAAFFAPPPETRVEEQDEHALALLELQAKVAYHEIPGLLPPAERVTALRELAARYGATETARSAREEAARLEGELASGLRESERLEQGLAGSVAFLRRALSWPPPEDELPRPFDLVRAAEAATPPAELAGTGRFPEARALVQAEILSTAAERGRAALARADELAARGAFAEVRELLARVAERLAAPEPAPGEAAGVAALRELAGTARQRLDGLTVAEGAYVETKTREDRALLAQRVGPAALGRLERLELGRLARELEALAPTLATEEARRRARALVEELARAQGALDLLVESFQAGAWRRFSVGVPSGGRLVPRDVVGAGPDGLLLASSASPEPAAWGTLLASGAAVDQVFRSRLNRAYSAEENERILALLHVVGAVEGAHLALGVLDPGRRRVLDPGEERALATVFAPLEAWAGEARAAGARDAGAFAREREAAELLAQALSASQKQAWTQATANTERLLRQYGDTLLVQVLSDGSATEPPRTPAQAAPPPGSATPPRGG